MKVLSELTPASVAEENEEVLKLPEDAELGTATNLIGSRCFVYSQEAGGYLKGIVYEQHNGVCGVLLDGLQRIGVLPENIIQSTDWKRSDSVFEKVRGRTNYDPIELFKQKQVFTPTLPWLRAAFYFAKHAGFNRELRQPNQWHIGSQALKKRKAAGMVSWGPGYSPIALHQNSFPISMQASFETLIHETVHIWQIDNDREALTFPDPEAANGVFHPRGPHGTVFSRELSRLNAKFGINSQLTYDSLKAIVQSQVGKDGKMPKYIINVSFYESKPDEFLVCLFKQNSHYLGVNMFDRKRLSVGIPLIPAINNVLQKLLKTAALEQSETRALQLLDISPKNAVYLCDSKTLHDYFPSFWSDNYKGINVEGRQYRVPSYKFVKKADLSMILGQFLKRLNYVEGFKTFADLGITPVIVDQPLVRD